MKKAILVRHAKSSWSDMSLRDHDRPLNGRGKRDGPKMATHLLQKIGSVDAIISSTAARARTTAHYFRQAFEDSIEDYILEEDLYHASVATIFGVIQRIDDRYDTVLLFGHNPGFTSFANIYHQGQIDNVPTCGIVGLEYRISTWSAANTENAKLNFFYYPKML